MPELRLPTAMDAWKAALSHIIEQGVDFRDQQGRTCREVLNLTVTIEHPDVGIDEPIDHVKNIDKWVYPSKDELVSIIFNRYDLPLYDYSYGSRIFGYQGRLDQVHQYLIPLLKKDPESRRGTIILLDPVVDLRPTNRNAPGLVSLHCKVQGRDLLMTAVVRSNDFFVGWPANIYQLASLQSYIAQAVGLRSGSLTTFSVSAHLFEDHFDDVREVLS